MNAVIGWMILAAAAGQARASASLIADIAEQVPIGPVSAAKFAWSAGGDLPRFDLSLPSAFGMRLEKSPPDPVNWKYYSCDFHDPSSQRLIGHVATHRRQIFNSVRFNTITSMLTDTDSDATSALSNTAIGGDGTLYSTAATDYQFSYVINNTNLLPTVAAFMPVALLRSNMSTRFAWEPSSPGKGAPVGAIGAYYRYFIEDRNPGADYKLELLLRDERGTVFHVGTGAQGTSINPALAGTTPFFSYEYINPNLRLVEGTLTYGAGNPLGPNTVPLKDGHCVLDHQGFPYPQGVPPLPNTQAVLAGLLIATNDKKLYYGGWLSLLLNDGRSMLALMSFNETATVATLGEDTTWLTYVKVWADYTRFEQVLSEEMARGLMGPKQASAVPLTKYCKSANRSNVNLDACRDTPTWRYNNPLTDLSPFDTVAKAQAVRTWKIVLARPGQTLPADTTYMTQSSRTTEVFYLRIVKPGYLRSPFSGETVIIESTSIVYSDPSLQTIVGYGLSEQSGVTA